METVILELNATINECIEAYKNVDSWAKPSGVPFNIQFSAMKPTVYKQPKGVALIIGPFNVSWFFVTLLFLRSDVQLRTPSVSNFMQSRYYGMDRHGCYLSLVTNPVHFSLSVGRSDCSRMSYRGENV
jgi:hypothetical protein